MAGFDTSHNTALAAVLCSPRCKGSFGQPGNKQCLGALAEGRCVLLSDFFTRTINLMCLCFHWKSCSPQNSSDIDSHLEQVSALFSCKSCSQACRCSHCIALERLGLNTEDHILSVQDREVLPYFVTIFQSGFLNFIFFLQSTFEPF